MIEINEDPRNNSEATKQHSEDGAKLAKKYDEVKLWLENNNYILHATIPLGIMQLEMWYSIQRKDTLIVERRLGGWCFIYRHISFETLTNSN